MCTDAPISSDTAARLIAVAAQSILGECASDAERQFVCVRLEQLFRDYAAELGRRKTGTHPVMSPEPSEEQADRVAAKPVK